MEREQTWELAELLTERLGKQQLLDSICAYFSADEIGRCLADIAETWDIDTTENY